VIFVVKIINRRSISMFSKRSIILFVLISTIFCISCGNKEEAVVPAGPLWKPSGNEGNITGFIAFNGEAPALRKMEMSQDSACEKMGESFFDDVIVIDGKMQNVFVYVKNGLPKASFEIPAAEVSLDQKGCQYVPRVLGIQTGQPLKILNSDPTDHNIHPVPKINREWNQSQLAGQGPITRKFAKEEALIQVKCNKHPWMTAWLGVLSHPFFAVSGADGSFTIRGLPPGEYELEAWHEKYGAKTLKVKVNERADSTADFTFNADTAYRASSLKIEPAVVIP
jgi:Carboxypeptidase regulatory-like domain